MSDGVGIVGMAFAAIAGMAFLMGIWIVPLMAIPDLVQAYSDWLSHLFGDYIAFILLAMTPGAIVGFIGGSIDELLSYQPTPSIKRRPHTINEDLIEELEAESKERRERMVSKRDMDGS